MPPPAEFVDCARAESLLEAHLDGELSQQLSRALESHLAGCPECRREAVLAGEIRAELRGLGELDPPDHLRESLRRATGGPAVSGRPRWQWLAAAAALLLAVLTALLLGPSRGSVNKHGDEELQRAIRDARVALALVASLNRRAGSELRDEAFSHRLVQPTVDRMLRPLHGTAGGGQTVEETTKAQQMTPKDSQPKKPRRSFKL